MKKTLKPVSGPPIDDWTVFANDLALTLARLDVGEFFIAEQKDSGYYVQALGGDSGLRVEAVSNFYLESDERLSDAACNQLLALGWKAPTFLPGTNPNRENANPNYFLNFDPPVPCKRVATLLVNTLRRAFGCTEPAGIEMRQIGSRGRRSAPRSTAVPISRALRALASERQQQRRRLADGILKYMETGGEIHDAIGAGVDGFENSLVIIADSNKPDEVDYISAIMGRDGGYDSTASFVPDPTGRDTLWLIDCPGEIKTVCRDIDCFGLRNKVLTATGDGVRVYVVDGGSQLRKIMEKVGEQYGRQVQFVRGHSRFMFKQ